MGCLLKCVVSAEDASGEPSKQLVESALEEAEAAGHDETGNVADEDLLDIPKDVMDLQVDKASKTDKTGKDTVSPDSEMSGVADSSSNDSSSSSSSEKPNPKKAQPAPKPKEGRGRGRGKAAAAPVPEVPKKRLVPLDTSDVKINPTLKLRLDAAADANTLKASAPSSSSKQPAKKRKT